MLSEVLVDLVELHLRNPDRFCGNYVIEEMRKDSPNLFPKRTSKPIKHLSEEELDKLVIVAEKIEGWYGAIIRLMVAIYPWTGLHPSELRLARLMDLNTSMWTIWVRHPKGEGNYGARRVVSLLPPCREAVTRFLKERDRHITSVGMKESLFLIPNLKGHKDRPYSANHFRKLKKELSLKSGIDFRLKDFRSTFASICVKKNPSLMPDVSKQLGHTSMEVTQRYYAEIEASDAGKRLCDAWSENNEVNRQRQKSVLIKPKEYLSGYA
jgi:integrase